MFDLRSGYHHVEIFPDHRKYLAFSRDFGDGRVKYFQFSVLPFGLSSSPYFFTKLLKPLLTSCNTLEGSISITGRRILKLKSTVDAIFYNDSSLVKARVLASVVGQIISLLPCVGTVARIMSMAMYAVINKSVSWNFNASLTSQGPVFQKPINTNPRLKINQELISLLPNSLQR